MHFHYDPILGLQYMTFEDDQILIYPVANIPIDFNVEEFMKRWKEQGLIFTNCTPAAIEIIEYEGPQITSNLLLTIN